MIDSYSAFYYGYRIQSQPFNGFLNIDEGAGELSIELPVGSYTLNTMISALRNALLAQGTLEYTVTADRLTRKFTISADQPFDLLANSGTQVGSSAWSLLGFDTTTDKTGASSYTSQEASAKAYFPQFPLQSYIPPEDFQSANQATKNIASDGTTVEVIRFGLAKFIEFDIKFITSKPGIADGVYIRKNPTGLEDAREFLQDVTRLSEFEFMPDRDNPGAFSRCIIEAMPVFADGTGYKLKELFGENLRDVYETGIIKLRVIE